MSRIVAQAVDGLREQRSPAVNIWLIAAAVMAPTFMVVLASTVVNVALPYIAGNVSASTEEATWTLTSYLAANAIVMPATGWLSRMFGRKRFVLGCIVVFCVGSLACGMAHSLGFLIMARVVQGFGGGAMQPIAQAVLLESFPVAKRGVAMSIYGLGVIVAPIIGPTLGGWIIDNYSWRWIFYINLPVGILSILLIQLFLEDPPYIRATRAMRIDYIGFILLATWVGSLLIMLDKGQQEDWFDSGIIRGLCVVFIGAFLAFIGWELRNREPVVDLRIWRDRTFATGTLISTVVMAVMFGCTAILPLFLQTLLGYPALQSGLAMTPRGFGALLAMVLVGRMITVVDGRLLVVFGFIALGYSTYALGNLNLEIAPVHVIWPNIINGAATGLIFVPLTVITMGRLHNEEVRNAAGIYNLMRNIGSAVGIAMMATFLARGAQVHQATLVSHMTPYDTMYQQQVQTIQSSLTPQVGAYDAGQKALAIVGAQLTRQSTLLAYIDDFRLLAIMAVACIPAMLLFRRPTPKKPIRNATKG